MPKISTKKLKNDKNFENIFILWRFATLLKLGEKDVIESHKVPFGRVGKVKKSFSFIGVFNLKFTFLIFKKVTTQFKIKTSH